MHPYLKFGLLTGAIVGALAWLAAGGVAETKTYYKTIEEMRAMGNDASVKRLRVAGDVENIDKAGQRVAFTIAQKENGKQFALNVVYHGTDPLPDTFRVGAQALCTGKMAADGTFHATQIQAKCASKYEAKAPTVKPEHAPVNSAAPSRI
jgi:cytochrome c-type biogenesis protein CcmE